MLRRDGSLVSVPVRSLSTSSRDDGCLLMVGLDDVASCYDLISMLEHQLRTARALLDELRERSSPVTQMSMSMVVDYCAELRAEAVEVVKASEMLQNDVCGPVSSDPSHGW